MCVCVCVCVCKEATNIYLDMARLRRFRAEMVERRVVLVLGGVLELSSSGMRSAAHALFSDNKHRFEQQQLTLPDKKSKKSRV